MQRKINRAKTVVSVSGSGKYQLCGQAPGRGFVTGPRGTGSCSDDKVRREGAGERATQTADAASASATNRTGSTAGIGSDGAREVRANDSLRGAVEPGRGLSVATRPCPSRPAAASN